MLRTGRNTLSKAECWSPPSVSTCSGGEKPSAWRKFAERQITCAVARGSTNLRAAEGWRNKPETTFSFDLRFAAERFFRHHPPERVSEARAKPAATRLTSHEEAQKA